MIAYDNLRYGRRVPDGLDSWCERWLGSPPAAQLFATGHLSQVTGLRLDDGQLVVVKVRPAAERLHACVALQQYLADAGFPCPRPLTGITPFNGLAAHAETLEPGGDVGTPHAVEGHAGLLAELVRVGHGAPPLPSLDPPPAWVNWDHGGDGLWPPSDERPPDGRPPDDGDLDLNAIEDERWIDDTGRRATWRLAELRAVAPVVGHADWEAQNIRWYGDAPIVHDWDSAVRLPEVALVGHAAAVWTAGTAYGFPTVEQTEAFLDAYQHASGRTFTEAELRQAWAAGLWTRAFNAKKWLSAGIDVLSADEAVERMRRAVIEPHFM
jgi:hypothetical protein